MPASRRATRDRVLEAIVEEVAVRQPGEAVVEGLVMDLANVPVEAPRHAAQGREERSEERDQPEPEDGCDRAVLGPGCGGDRRVGLVHLEHAGRRVRARQLARARTPRVPSGSGPAPPSLFSEPTSVAGRPSIAPSISSLIPRRPDLASGRSRRRRCRPARTAWRAARRRRGSSRSKSRSSSVSRFPATGFAKSPGTSMSCRMLWETKTACDDRLPALPAAWPNGARRRRRRRPRSRTRRPSWRQTAGRGAARRA